ncbi:hypothetical protein [Methylobacterium sp. WSM2598]|uniref:hypothetical protein n=1 Tax=Methylobacterium sp. WSM2598 TaxID=398261 RepID=UPI0012F69599|nr:hypothetical protein [Methylobacterium sp. WSM2598]
MNTADDQHATASTSATRSPTRRRLLALFAGLPHAVGPNATATRSVPRGDTDTFADPIPDLFSAFEAAVIRHEAALWRCDRLEAWLLAELHHPRVQLPAPAGTPVRYAADPYTIAQHLPPGRRRYRLQQVLLRRQQAWARSARASGLTRAQEQEATLNTAVREAAATLIAAPAHTHDSICIKLLVLLAVQEPDEAFRDCSPWPELRVILTDLSRHTDRF